MLLAAPSPIQITARSRSVQPGEIVVLSIVAPDGAGDIRVHAFGRDVAAYRDSGGAWRALVGIDLDVKPGTYAVLVQASGGASRATYELVVKPRVFRTRRLTVNEAFVTPPASEQARIDRDAALLAGVWNAPAAERLWSGPFLRPVPQEANSAFGTRRSSTASLETRTAAPIF